MNDRRGEPLGGWVRWLPALIVLVAVGLFVTGITRESLWRDEVDSIRFADEIWEQLQQNGAWPDRARTLLGYLTRPGWNGPLYFLTLEPWLQVAGRSELALRLPSALAGVLAVALGYALGARLLGRPAGRWLALLLAVNPYLVWYAGEGKMYALITALALLSTYLLLRALAEGHWWLWLSYVLATTALFYTHILTPLLLPVQLLLALLIRPRALLSAGALLSAACLVLPYLPLLIWQWPHITQPAETGFPFVPLVVMAWRQAQVFSRGIIGWPPLVPAGLLLGAALLGLLSGRRRAVFALLVWLALPPLTLYLISLRRPLFTERYLIWTLPALLALAAAGLSWLGAGGAAWRRCLAALWAAGMLVVGLLGVAHQWTQPVRPDLRGATALVAGAYQSGDQVLFQIPYLQHSFRYYAPDLDIEAVDGPYTNAGATPEEVDAYLRGALGDHRRVWLLLSEVEMWDAAGHTLAWFETHGRLLQDIPLNRVRVILWAPDDS